MNRWLSALVLSLLIAAAAAAVVFYLETGEQRRAAERQEAETADQRQEGERVIAGLRKSVGDFRNDRAIFTTRVVVGEVDKQTPEFHTNVVSVLFNPPWNVPSSIATKELWPKEKAHPGYLKRNAFVVIHTDDGGMRLQQKAGAKSALGRYKFDFDNPYGVYLHDTPTQSTFARYGRQASHGCVRLEKPKALAEALLAGDPAWTPDAITAAIDKGDTVRVRLARQVPVFVFYWTAFVLVDISASLLGMAMEKRAPWKEIVWLPVQRFGYRQMMYYVVVKAVITAINGPRVGWGKLERRNTAAVEGAA